MKAIIRITLLIFLSAISNAYSQNLRKVTQDAFQLGEELKYRIHYGFMDAGEAVLTVAPEMKSIGTRNCFKVTGTGRSLGAFDWFFKVRDRYESYIDSDAMVPWLFIRNVEEGSYTKNQNVIFNHYKSTATSEKKTIKTPGHVQDLISAFYYARTIDFNNAAPGDTFLINTYLDDETFPLVIKYIGKETIKTKKGKFKCIKFKPFLLEGRVFKEKEGMVIWISDDKNRIPIRAEAEIMVGSIKMDLSDYKGVAHPLAMVK